jgi:transcriptional regulator with AAA-type ATPase domain
LRNWEGASVDKTGVESDHIQQKPYAGGRRGPPLTPIGDVVPLDQDPGGTGRSITVEIPPGPPIEGAVRLWIETGPYGVRPRDVLLQPGAEIVLGSGDAADVRVKDPAVSARHCRVAHTGAAVEVGDLGSRNGVRVGGVRVGRAALPLGGAWEMGSTSVRVDPTVGPAAPAPDVPPLPGLVGTSARMRALAAAVRRIAKLRLPVLVRGESGTGKDLVAAAIHAESPRSGRPYVALNAAAISRDLAESELFGHRRGAFTGAVRDRRGAFLEANGGSLFLDEIGAVPADVQVKLLRAVEEGVVRPLGSERGAAVDVRLVAATCEPLEAMVAERLFRADLYERLAVCVVEVPALRDRPEDIPVLARHLLAASDLGDRQLSRDALAALRVHRWPGNVRELRNVVVQAAVQAGGQVIEAKHVADVLVERSSRPRRIAPGEAVRIFEHAGRNVSAAARLADLPRSTMRDLLRTAGVAAWPNR